MLDVPPPACRPGGVLVRTLYSLISTGTEMMKVSEARCRCSARPEPAPTRSRKVDRHRRAARPRRAYKKAMNRLDSYTPLGYSLCGVVDQVGAGATEFR